MGDQARRQAIGVATAPGRLLTAATAPSYPLTHPVVVKPVAAGSSHGVSLVREPAELGPALDAAFALDDRVLVEDLVVGREIDVAVLGRPDGSRIVSPALEIVVDGLFDHATKYGGPPTSGSRPRSTTSPRKELEDAAVAVFDALGCAGVARVDFFLTDSGRCSTRSTPCPASPRHSQVPRMFAAAGLPYADLLDLLVTDALRTGPR